MPTTAAEPTATAPGPAIGKMSPAVGRAIEAMGEHRPVGLLDDTVEGRPVPYLVAAAEMVEADVIAAIIREAPGRPVLVLGDDRARALGLGTFVATNPAMPRHLEMIDARRDVTTGVSVADVVRTVRVAANPGSGARDVVVPGHVPVVRVASGAVLERLGAPEAAFELSRLAGFAGGAVMCPLMADDGDLATPADLHRWVERYDTSVISTTDTLDARLSAEGLLSIESESTVDLNGLRARAVTFVDLDASARHLALLVGGSSGGPVCLTVLAQDPLVDVFDRSRSPIDRAIATLRARDDAVLCYVAPMVSAESDGSRGEEHRRSLLVAKRQAHVVSHMLSLLGIGAIGDQLESRTDGTH